MSSCHHSWNLSGEQVSISSSEIFTASFYHCPPIPFVWSSPALFVFLSLSHLFFPNSSPESLSLPPFLYSEDCWGRRRAGGEWATEDEMVACHHQLSGCESEWARETVKYTETWQAAVHGIAKSQTWLSGWTRTTTEMGLHPLLRWECLRTPPWHPFCQGKNFLVSVSWPRQCPRLRSKEGLFPSRTQFSTSSRIIFHARPKKVTLFLLPRVQALVEERGSPAPPGHESPRRPLTTRPWLVLSSRWQKSQGPHPQLQLESSNLPTNTSTPGFLYFSLATWFISFGSV